jgi:Xaa-Pro aminopeptidase
MIMSNINDANLKKLREILKERLIDYFILPNNDEFFSEYLPESEKRIEFLSGFSGSNAVIVVSQKQCQFFTDGRYILQSKEQLNLKEYKIHNMAQESLFSWLKDNLTKNQSLAINAKNHDIAFVNKIIAVSDESQARLSIIAEDFFDQIWLKKPKSPDSKVYFHDLKYSGKDSIEKRKKITTTLDEDAILLTSPASIGWLLNIRASDIEYTPFLLAYGILYKNNQVELFCDPKRIDDLNSKKLNKVNFIHPKYLVSKIAALKLKIKNIQIDPSSTNCWIYNLLKSGNLNLIAKQDPCLLPKAIKNEIEIKSAIKAHHFDGLAVTKFLFWLENTLKKGTLLDEIKLEEKLLEFRKFNKEFLYPSFASISSFGSNGAIIHYQASKKTNKKITGNSLYLIDSGGQYFYGTTDITRTVAIGSPISAMKNDFTRVLKGHITLARARFPVGTTGNQLDPLARFSLWQDSKDYDHGTGHGVGSFLSVHEGPVSISKRAQTQSLLPGMILSNEPGYYKEGEYGIRIENLILVQQLSKNKNFLHFKTLTLAPIDPKLIDFKMLTHPEKKWLYDYHQEIYDNLAKELNQSEKKWLNNITKIYKMAQ